MSKIARNIKHLRLLKNWSQGQLADEVELSRARIGSYEEGRAEPSIEVMVRLSHIFHVSIDALVKSNLSGLKDTQLMKVAENRLLFPIMVDMNNNDLVEVVTAKASAGYLNGYSDPEYFEKLPNMNLPFKITGKHRAFPIKGDSMPPLKDGSFVVGKFVESIKDIHDGSTYILITKDEGIVYKRVVAKGNVLELISDNKVYSPYTVHAKDVLEIWEFVCTLNVSDKKEEELNLESIMDMLRSMRVEIEQLKKN
ncbi:XRE family transcriptional regulator [Bacteroidetes bacterium UKL13-3]|jgi:transcriptional regulator with XRE-family HTH domain|nr:XRE family transcriptional regulator [Bacteroidetes bacterium UKL13-3]HCP94338.1 XRE family transcriptional regulator [Bacteroidota bacterium]